MKTIFLLENLKSRYCRFVFLASLIVGYVLTPKNVLTGTRGYVAVIFIVLFAFNLACMVRSIKEKIKTARVYKKSILGLLTSIVGISALQVCGLGTPVCGASMGMGLLSAVFPGFLISKMQPYGEIFLVVSIVLLMISLRTMNCLFVKNNKD